MAFQLYDYVDGRGVNVIRQWTESVVRGDRRQLGKLNGKLDMLERDGPDLSPQLLAGVPKNGLLRKLKVQGNPKLRPILCQGPDPESFTLLVGAIEKDWEIDPTDAYAIAERRRQDLFQNTETRRRKHERVT